jgi:hypothetical protein
VIGQRSEPTAQELYLGLGRAPDPAGLAFWESYSGPNREATFAAGAAEKGEQYDPTKPMTIGLPGQTTTTSLSGMTPQQRDLSRLMVSKMPTTPTTTAPGPMFTPGEVNAQLELERLRLQPTPEPPAETPVAGFAQGGLVGNDINRLLQNQRNAIQRESQSRQMLTNLGAPPVKKFSDGGPAGSSSGVRRLEMSKIRRRQEGSPVEGEMADDMFVGTRPEDFPETSPVDKKAGELLRALGQGNVMQKQELKSSFPSYNMVEALPTRSEQALRAYVEAANPRASIKQQRLSPGILGAVRSKNPDEILISNNPKQSPGAMETNVFHELEHSLSLRGGNPLGALTLTKGEPIVTDNNYRFDILYNMKDKKGKKIEKPNIADLLLLSQSGEGEKKRLTMVQNFIDNRPEIEYFFGRPIDSSYFSPNMFKAQLQTGSEGALFEEQIADLSALEQLTGKSLTRDKEMKKLLFPDDRSAEVYDAITGYRQTRLDSKDLPPYTPVSPEDPSVLDRLKGLFGRKEGGDVTNDEFIQEMMTGTRPSSFPETSPVDTAVSDFISSRSKLVTDPQEFFRVMGQNIEEYHGKPLREDPEKYLMEQLGPGVLGGIIKPKGGNVVTQDLMESLKSLRPSVLYEGYRPASEADKLIREQMKKEEESGRGISASTKRIFEENKPKAALDDWIQNKLGRYIRTEMGSEDDPVRKLGEEMTEKIRSAYEAGFKRIAKMKDKIAEAKAMGKNTDISEAELADEIDKVENAYRQTSKLPVDQGPYLYPRSRTGRAREKAGFSPYPISKSDAGKEWEGTADALFEVHKAGDLVKQNSPLLFDNPWIAKLDPKEIVYQPKNVDEPAMFTHTIDELKMP